MKPEYCFAGCPHIEKENYFQNRCEISGIILPRTDDGRCKRDWNMASDYFPQCPDLKK